MSLLLLQSTTHFVMMVTGQIEAGRYEGLDSLYCRYTFSHGDDWQVARGVEEGITQMSSASGSTASDTGELAVWNFPVDVTFRSTGAHGWPQIVVSVYGTDAFGRSDMIVGYGAAHLPMAPGRHELYVRTFRPLASSLLQRLQSWLMGARPEFRDSQFPSKGEGRDVTRVQSFGCVKVVVDVTLQGMEELGYSVAPPSRPAVRLGMAP
jgi:B9 domain-containing protein 1